MLKKGQIKFTKKAAEIAKAYFEKKKVSDFLTVVDGKEQKPSGYKDFYKILLGEKQNLMSLNKIYSKDLMRTKKIFEVSLIKEGRLSMLLYLSKNCLLYISKLEQSKFEEIKLPETNWPMAIVNENDNGAMIKFIAQMRTKAVDLTNLILEINNQGGEAQ